MNIEENAENYIPDQEDEVNPNIKEDQQQKPQNNILQILFSQTGEGTIESYNNHPMNIKNDKSISQILRGFTGILGNLNFALIDILLGGFSFFKDKNNNSNIIDIKESEQNV